MSNFSKFFNRIYELRNSSIKNRKDFLNGFFNAAGRDAVIYMSDESIKSICNGIRNLSEELMSQFPNPSLTNKEKEYLMNTLNKNRIMDFFNAFEIDEEEKQNFELLCKAIAVQFENYMKYGDNPSTTVESIYKYLLDLALPKNKNNNEEAVYSAKTLFFNSLQEFSKIDKSKSLVDSRGSLDNVFQLIFSSFKAFETRCNHDGLDKYKAVRNEMIYKNEKLNKYIKMASEPGSLPLPLSKSVNVIIYENQQFNDVKARIKLGEDGVHGYNITAKAVEGTNIGRNEGYAFFTEIYVYSLEDDDANLLPGLFDALMLLYKFWNKIEDEISTSVRIKVLDKKIGNLMPKCREKGFTYYYDGTYYYESKSVKYDLMIEDLIFDRDNHTVYTEDYPVPLNEHPVIKDYGTCFKDMFIKYVNRIIDSVRKSRGILSTECMLLSDDDMVRWFVCISPARSTITRKIRKMADLAYENKGRAFLWASKHFGCELEQHDDYYVKALGREKYDATDFICIYGCEGEKVLSCCVRTMDLFEDTGRKIIITEDPFMYFLNPIRFGIINRKDGRD